MTPRTSSRGHLSFFPCLGRVWGPRNLGYTVWPGAGGVRERGRTQRALRALRSGAPSSSSCLPSPVPWVHGDTGTMTALRSFQTTRRLLPQVHSEGQPQAGPCGRRGDLGFTVGGEAWPCGRRGSHRCLRTPTPASGSRPVRGARLSDPTEGFYRVSSSRGPQDLSASPSTETGGLGSVAGFVLSSSTRMYFPDWEEEVTPV